MAEVVVSGLYPVQNHYDNVFINVGGENGGDEDFKNIAGFEQFDIAFEKTTTDYKGWENKGFFGGDVTGLKVTVSGSGKRIYGDAANDYIASTAWYIGNKTRSKFKWIMPDGTTVKFNVVINTSKIAGGATDGDDELETTFIMNGGFEMTPADGAEG